MEKSSPHRGNIGVYTLQRRWLGECQCGQNTEKGREPEEYGGSGHAVTWRLCKTLNSVLAVKRSFEGLTKSVT